MKKITLPVLIAATMVSACASKSSDISASYVSTMQYQSYTCDQIAAEARNVSARASQAMAAQDNKAQGDTTKMAVGMVLFWPTLFFLKGDSESAAEVARLKGEMEALEKANVEKGCGLKFERATKSA